MNNINIIGALQSMTKTVQDRQLGDAASLSMMDKVEKVRELPSMFEKMIG